MKNIFKVVWVLIGTIIGAGFASGQEINLFFISYGLGGLFGIILMSILTGLMTYKVLDISKKNNIKNYKELVQYIMEKRGKFLNSNNIINVQNAIVNIFLFGSFAIMIAGFASFLTQEYELNHFLGSIIIVIIFFIVCIKKQNGIVNINQILTPILVIGILVMGISSIKNIDIHVFDNLIKSNNSNWIIGSVIYCSYNLIVLIPITISMASCIKNKKEARIASTLVSVVIAIMAIIIYFLLSSIDIDSSYLDIPIMYAIKNINKVYAHIYSIVILFSILTSCISAGYSFLENVCKKDKSYPQIVLIMCIIGVIISNFGFSNLVSLLYPTFGIIGILQMIFLIKTKS